MRLSAGVLLAAACMAARPSPGGETRPAPTPCAGPALGISDAVAAAEKWARGERVDLSGQYINYARLCYDEGPARKGSYWHVQWAWATPRLGGEFGARVYMDGTVAPQRCGP